MTFSDTVLVVFLGVQEEKKHESETTNDRATWKRQRGTTEAETVTVVLMIRLGKYLTTQQLYVCYFIGLMQDASLRHFCLMKQGKH